MARMMIVRGYRKGSRVLRGADRHLYHLNRVMAGGRLSFRCCYYYKNNCRGRCAVDMNGQHFKVTQRHNHLPEKKAIELRRFRHAVLSRCRSGGHNDDFKRIYNEERRRLKLARGVAATLPLQTLRPSMQSARAKSFPNNPKTIADLSRILTSPNWPDLGKTLDRKDSLVAAAGGKYAQKTQFIVLMSRRMNKYLGSVKKIFSDGTFCTPAQFECSQIFNLVTVRRNHKICLARVLMQSRKKECYVEVLQAIKNLQPKFKPKVVVADFEKAQQKAWKEVYPRAKRYGCLFHSNKNINGRAKKIGLGRLIRKNKTVRSLVRSLGAVPLLPHSKIDKGLISVAKRANKTGHWIEMEPLLRYMHKTWLSGQNREIFSVYRCTDRTSNVCESDNAELRATIRAKHPSVWSFLSAVAELEDIHFQNIKILDAGRNPGKPQRASSLANDRTLLAMWRDLDDGTMSVRKFLIQASFRVNGLFSGFFSSRKK